MLRKITFIILGICSIWSTQFFKPLFLELSQRAVSITPVAFGHADGTRMMPTHYYLNKNLNKRVISDFANSRFIYSSFSEKETDVWASSNIPTLNRPHALTYSPEAERYFAVDTDNNQLISFSSFDISSKDDIRRYSDVHGIAVGKRPHDIFYNDKDSYIYVVLNSGVLRFKAIGNDLMNSGYISKKQILKSIRKNQPHADFKIGYVRSLTILDGALYLSNSTQGNIIKIGNFLNPETWTVIINKARSKKYAEKGSFKNDGLILNDIEYFKGYWYATNYYAGNVNNYTSDKLVSENKLIRWRTWKDFENSKWQDLSRLVHPESITYNFTKDKNTLYISMFHAGNSEGIGSGVYALNTGFF